MKVNIERRFTAGAVELRAASAADAQTLTVRGYAAMYNKRSENFGSADRPFFEEIQPGAFDGVLADDVRALFNHDANLILARSKGGAGTLRVGSDDVGLWYEFDPADTQMGRDLVTSLRRGDVDQSSFAFTVSDAGQEFRKDGNATVRVIKKVDRLYDVSPVTYPAYPDTTVAMRSAEEFQRAEISAKENQHPERSYWAACLGIL